MRYIKVGKKYKKSHLYQTWWNMKTRCYNKKHGNYKNYGVRGITICDEWKNSFDNFSNWAMNNGYRENLTIDRIDSNGNYEPSNCRWVTIQEQENNRTNNHKLSFNGEIHTISEWSRKLHIAHSTLKVRLNRGWSIERALTTPNLKKKGQ